MSDEWVVTMPKLGETVTEGDDHQLAQAGRRHGGVRRPAVRGVHRQGRLGDPQPVRRGDRSRSWSQAGETVPVGTPLVRIGAAGQRDGRCTHAGSTRRPPRPAHTAAAGGPALGDPAAPQMGGSEGMAGEDPERRRAGRRRARHHHAQARRDGHRGHDRQLAQAGRRHGRRSTTRCSRCPPTRSTRRSPARTTASCSRSWCPRARPCRSAPPLARIGEPGAAPAAAPAASRRAGSGARPAAAAGAAAGAGRTPRPARRRSTATAGCCRRWSAGSSPRPGWTSRRSPAPGPAAGSGARTWRRRWPGGGSAGRAPAAAAPAVAAPAAAHRPRRHRRHRPPRPAAPAARAAGDPRDEVVALSRMRLAVAAGMKASQADHGVGVDLGRGRLRQRRAGAPEAQGPVQEGDRRVAVLPAVRLPGDGRRAAGVPDRQLLDRHRGEDDDAAPVRQPRHRGRPRPAGPGRPGGQGRRLAEHARHRQEDHRAGRRRPGARSWRCRTCRARRSRSPTPARSPATRRRRSSTSPTSAILCTDGVKRRPVAVGDAIAIHPTGIIGLVYDHRAFDGSTASLFLMHIRDSLEQRDWEAEVG